MSSTAGHEDVTNYLLGVGADANATSDDLQTPLLCACSSGRLGVVKVLVKWGANIGQRTVEGFVLY